MFKHFLWFIRKPADERETALLSAAYQRALVVLWFGIIVIWFAARVAGESIISSQGIFILPLLLLLSILGGVWTLRDEELEYKNVKIERTPSLAVMAIIASLLFLAALGLVYLNAGYLWIAAIGFTIAELALGAYATWRWTAGYTTHARLLGSLIFPFQTLGYLSTDNRKYRVSYMLLSSFWFLVAPIIIAIILLSLPSHTFVGYLQWDGYLVPGVFDSALEGNQVPASHRVILDYRDTDVAVGDIVQYNKLVNNIIDVGGNGQMHPGINESFGRVMAINGENVTLDVSDGESQSVNSALADGILLTELHHTEIIRKSDIIATAIINAPGAALAEAILW
jgi:hypothetical protein